MSTIKKIGTFIASRALYLALGVFLAVGATYVYATWDEARTLDNSNTNELTQDNWNKLVTMVETEIAAKPYMQMKTGTYTGNGVDNRNIDIGVDLSSATYKWLVVDANNAARYAMNKFGHQTTDISNFFTDGNSIVNGMQAWTATGFEVGTSPWVNTIGFTYNYAVFWVD